MYETPVQYETKSFSDENMPCVRELSNHSGFVKQNVQMLKQNVQMLSQKEQMLRHSGQM
jgi:hypothetical protein